MSSSADPLGTTQWVETQAAHKESAEVVAEFVADGYSADVCAKWATDIRTTYQRALGEWTLGWSLGAALSAASEMDR